MRTTLRMVALGAAVALPAVATAATHTVKFDGADGETTALWYGYPEGGSNIGTQQGQLLLAHPNTDWYFAAGLLRVKSLPDGFVGGTVNSATLVMNDNWGTNSIYQGVQVHRIDTPANWKVGDGSQADRWPNLGRARYDDGAGRRLADWTGNDVVVNGIGGRQGTGVDWLGNPVVGDESGDYTTFDDAPDPLPAFEDSAMSTLVTTGRLVGPASTGVLLPGEARGMTTFDVTTLVQNWANGSWDVNDGFAIWMGNASLADGTHGTHGWVFSGENSGLFIDFTPVPEPASLGLVAIGGLALLGRRRS